VGYRPKELNVKLHVLDFSPGFSSVPYEATFEKKLLHLSSVYTLDEGSKFFGNVG
jgi:hypothetical protein